MQHFLLLEKIAAAVPRLVVISAGESAQHSMEHAGSHLGAMSVRGS